MGYIHVTRECKHADVAGIAEQQCEIGYPSTFVEGERESPAYVRGLFDDSQAPGSTSVLHEQRGGQPATPACSLGDTVALG